MANIQLPMTALYAGMLGASARDLKCDGYPSTRSGKNRPV